MAFPTRKEDTKSYRFTQEACLLRPEKPESEKIEDVDLKKLADMTHGYTGADLSALGRETAMKALRRYLPQINLEEERIPPAVLEKMEVKMEDFLGRLQRSYAYRDA